MKLRNVLIVMGIIGLSCGPSHIGGLCQFQTTDIIHTVCGVTVYQTKVGTMAEHGLLDYYKQDGLLTIDPERDINFFDGCDTLLSSLYTPKAGIASTNKCYFNVDAKGNVSNALYQQGHE